MTDITELDDFFLPTYSITASIRNNTGIKIIKKVDNISTSDTRRIIESNLLTKNPDKSTMKLRIESIKLLDTLDAAANLVSEIPEQCAKIEHGNKIITIKREVL